MSNKTNKTFWYLLDTNLCSTKDVKMLQDKGYREYVQYTHGNNVIYAKSLIGADLTMLNISNKK